MGCFVVDVHKRTVHVGQLLDLVLELLAEIMCLPERRLGIHHDVNFDEVIWPALISQSRQTGSAIGISRRDETEHSHGTP